MSTYGQMDKGNVICIYNGILFTTKKEGNSAICEKWMDWGHYAKWNKSEKTKILYVEYEKVRFIETESSMFRWRKWGDSDLSI